MCSAPAGAVPQGWDGGHLGRARVVETTVGAPWFARRGGELQACPHASAARIALRRLSVGTGFTIQATFWNAGGASLVRPWPL